VKDGVTLHVRRADRSRFAAGSQGRDNGLSYHSIIGSSSDR